MLKKYYTSLLYKLTCQVSGKKTTFERFNLIVELMTDEKVLRSVLDLYDIKLQNDDELLEQIEDMKKTAKNEFPIFTEVNKAYYISVLDKTWAQEIYMIEL